jgi:hypothetical protein
MIGVPFRGSLVVTQTVCGHADGSLLAYVCEFSVGLLIWCGVDSIGGSYHSALGRGGHRLARVRFAPESEVCM